MLMGRFIIPLQQAPPRRRHLRSPTSPSHFAFRIHAQQRCSTPPAAAAWLISHQALHFSSKRPISHVAQQCFTSDIVNLPRLHRGDALNKVVHFLMLRRLMPGSSGVPSKKKMNHWQKPAPISRIHVHNLLDEDVSSNHLELHYTSQ